MDIQGYAEIKHDAKSGFSPIDIKHFLGKLCRVIEFSKHDGGVLVVDNEGQGLATFDKQDVYRSFECSRIGEVICPPNLNDCDKFIYVSKCMNRKGGYNRTVASLVIASSLMKGIFNDQILWAKQD